MSHTQSATTGAVHRRNGQILFGLAIALVGFALLLERAGWWHLTISLKLWPALPLLMGAGKLLNAGGERRRSARGGLWLISVGLWGLISEFQLFGFTYATSWPLLVVAVGLNIVAKSLEGPSAPRAEGH